MGKLKSVKGGPMTGKLESLQMFLVATCFIVLLPIILPWSLIESSIYDRRKRRIAEQTRCACGTVLGMPALKLNSEVCAATVAEARAMHPGCRISFRIFHDAICTSCGQWYLYHSDPPRFVAVDKPAELDAHKSAEAGDDLAKRS